MNPTLWIPAVWAQYRAGNLTPLFRDVLLRLQKFDRGRGLWPAHDTLAEAARCSVRTVQDALAQGRRLGLLDWVSGAGRRTSNRYSLTLPKVAVEAGVRLGRAASRAVAKVAALGRALVGRMREEGEQTASKRPTGQGRGWKAWPEPQAPVRSVAEQLAILASCSKEEARTGTRTGTGASGRMVLSRQDTAGIAGLR
jgi:hypothetical protein